MPPVVEILHIHQSSLPPIKAPVEPIRAFDWNSVVRHHRRWCRRTLLCVYRRNLVWRICSTRKQPTYRINCVEICRKLFRWPWAKTKDQRWTVERVNNVARNLRRPMNFHSIPWSTVRIPVSIILLIKMIYYNSIRVRTMNCRPMPMITCRFEVDRSQKSRKKYQYTCSTFVFHWRSIVAQCHVLLEMNFKHARLSCSLTWKSTRHPIAFQRVCSLYCVYTSSLTNRQLSCVWTRDDGGNVGCDMRDGLRMTIKS